jgi:cell division protein FtsB
VAQDKREQLRKLRTLTQAQAAVGWAVILFLLALLGTIYLRQVGQTATIGRETRSLQAELNRLKAENSVLERNIAEAQQLDRLQIEARELGFEPATANDLEYLVVPNYPAAVQGSAQEETAEPAVPAPPPLETMRAAISRFIRTQFSDFIRGEAHEE